MADEPLSVCGQPVAVGLKYVPAQADDEEEDLFVGCGDGASDEVRAFDCLVGCVEDFMFAFDLKERVARLPSLATVPSDHERYIHFKELIRGVHRDLDAHIAAFDASYHDPEHALAILMARQEEISEEVWSFVRNDWMEYPAFLEFWVSHNP